MPRCFASAQASRKQRAVYTQIVLVTDSRRLEARQHNPGNAHVGGTVHGGGNGLFRRIAPFASGLGGHAVLQDSQHGYSVKPDAV